MIHHSYRLSRPQKIFYLNTPPRSRRTHTGTRKVYALGSVETVVKSGPANSRFVFGSVQLAAPSEASWRALTNYEKLHTFIPGLTVNECIRRFEGGGARLLQVGAQDIAFGIKFSARCVLDVLEFPEGLPQDCCISLSSYEYTRSTSDSGESDGDCLFPLPRVSLSGLPYKDLTFKLVEGDFLVFRGMWRMQEVGPNKTRLSYALFVRPHPWLPVGLIQSRVQKEVAANLRAVGTYVESRQSQLLQQVTTSGN